MKSVIDNKWFLPLFVGSLGIICSVYLSMKLKKNNELSVERLIELEAQRFISALQVNHDLLKVNLKDCIEQSVKSKTCFDGILKNEYSPLFEYNLLYEDISLYQKNHSKELKREKYIYNKSFTVEGLKFQLLINPNLEYAHVLQSDIPPSILLFGPILAIILALLIYSSISHLKKGLVLKKIKVELEVINKRFVDFMNASDSIFSIYDNNFKLLEINQAGLDLFQKSKNQLLNQSLFTVMEHINKYDVHSYINLFQEKGSFEFIDEFPINGQNSRFFKTKVFKMKEGFGILSEDITKIRNFNEQLKQKNQELEQYIYAASHDLQEPLNTINSFIEILETEHTDWINKSDIQQYFRFITEASQRMKNQIKGLLDHGKIGQNKQIQEIDTREVLEEVFKDMEHTFKKSNPIVQLPKALPILKGYRTEVKLLFQNLISNAIKYQKTGNQPVIKIAVSIREKDWLFKIHDNGIGFDSKYSERIFQLFQRLHNNKKYKGTGIGLAQCKKIIELHEGRIWADSVLGQGSTFYFTVPNHDMV